LLVGLIRERDGETDQEHDHDDHDCERLTAFVAHRRPSPQMSCNLLGSTSHAVLSLRWHSRKKRMSIAHCDIS
jgi:hypothetical protein